MDKAAFMHGLLSVRGKKGRAGKRFLKSSPSSMGRISSARGRGRLVGLGVGLLGLGLGVDLAEALAWGLLDQGVPGGAGIGAALGAGLTDDLVEAAAGAAGADRRAAADPGAAGIFERLRAGRPGLARRIVGIAAERRRNPVALSLGLPAADDDRVVGAGGAWVVAVDDHRADLGLRARRRRRLGGGGRGGEQCASGEEEGVHGRILFDSAMAIRQPARMREDNMG